MNKSLFEGWRSTDPLYWLNYKHVRGLIIFLHFIIHLVSSSWITSHPTSNDQTSVVCHSDLLPTFLALSLSVSVIFPFAGWWCRQEWHLSVRKETEQWSALAHWLQVAVSGCLLELQFGFLSCAIRSSSYAPHCAVFGVCFWHWSLAWARGRGRDREGLNIPSIDL